jgi:integrase
MEQSNFFLNHNQSIEQNSNLSNKSKNRLYHSKADSTIQAYNSDWKDFVDWCQHHQTDPLPATPETIVNYINDLADYAKANTVARRVTAISENHIAAGYTQEKNAAHHHMVRAAIAAIKREKGTYQQGKMPILYETLSLLAEYLQGNSPEKIRDKALIFLGFAGAFRRSELVAIQVEHLTFTPQGLIIFIPKAKKDQFSRGERIAIPYAKNANLCAVKAIKQWLEYAHITHGPVFRPLKRNKQPHDYQMNPHAVANIVKKYVSMIGLDASQFAGHSLRRGFATSAAQHNAGVLEIMKQTRHKSEAMVHRYIEEGQLFENNPLDKIYH